jgi:methionyl-tRNA formyltransferase
MNVVFMGKHKRSAVRALAWLVEQGCDVRAVVAPEPDELTVAEQRLDLVADRHGLTLASDEQLYAAIERPDDGAVDLRDVDLVLSFLFWRRIRAPLIALPRVACLNFHPAPLPDMRGLGGYNVAILEGWREWGVSAHVVDEDLDTGDLVAVDRFPIDPDVETALSLDLQSQERLFALFRRVIDALRAGEELPRTPQGEGRYVSREEFERLRRLRPGDDVARKVRAFWYPPHPGATVEFEGRALTLVDEDLLAELARLYRDAGLTP